MRSVRKEKPMQRTIEMSGLLDESFQYHAERLRIPAEELIGRVLEHLLDTRDLSIIINRMVIRPKGDPP